MPSIFTEGSSLLSDFFIAALIAIGGAIWLWKRPVRQYNVRAGVLRNLDVIKSRLDSLGVSYTYRFPVDGTPDMTVDEDIGGVLRRRRIRPEVAWGIIEVQQAVDSGTVKKAVSVGGYTYPHPRITLAITPQHCWGFDPHALTTFNRDPKISQVEYDLTDIRPNDLRSQFLPKKTINAAVRYLSWEVPQNHYEMHHEEIMA